LYAQLFCVLRAAYGGRPESTCAAPVALDRWIARGFD